MADKIPKEVEEFAAEHSAEVVAWNPNQLAAFLAGQITLAQLEGMKPEELQQFANTGYNLISNGRLDDALKIFEALAVLNPYDAYTQMAQGSIAHQKGNLEEAERFYSRAIELNKNSIAAFANRGEVRLLQGKIVEALSDLLAVIEKDPDAKDPLSRRSKVLAAMLRDKISEARQKKAGSA